MKKSLPLCCLFGLLGYQSSLHAQNCSVIISGGNCTGNELTANVSGETLGTITWYQDENISVFGADTISSSNSVSLVAGNHGSGSSSNQFGFPSGGISVDGAGNVYVADKQNSRIQKWAPGAITGVTVAGGHGVGSASDQLRSPKDVFVDAAGNIYVADFGNNRIQKWAPGATSGVTVAGGNGFGSSDQQLNGPSGVYVEANGKIYIADTYNYRIQRWAPGADKGVTVAGGNGSGLGADQFDYPIDVYLDAAKNIYIADANTEDAENHRVQKWAQGATSGISVAGGVGTNEFGYLLAIYVDAAGNVYTADNGLSGAPVSRIQKWLPGAVSGITVAGGHSSGWDVLSFPTGVALDNTGLIYVLDGTYNPRVQKYIPTNGIVDKTYTPSLPGSYTVQAVFKNGCSAQSPAFKVSAIPGTPHISATERGGRGNLCEGGIDSFYVYPWDDTTSYTWKIPAQCSLVANNNDSIIIKVPAGFSEGLLRVKAINFCGTSMTDTMRLLGRPAKPFRIIGPHQVFANQTNIIYSVDNRNNIYNWTVPQGAAIVSGQGTSTIHVNWGAAAGTISVSASNDCGMSQRNELYILLKSANIIAERNVSDYKNKAGNDVQVFPNPAKETATVIYNSKKQTTYTIELRDLSGKVLIHKENISIPGINTINLDVRKYASGIYFINLMSTDKKISLKLNSVCPKTF